MGEMRNFGWKTWRDETAWEGSSRRRKDKLKQAIKVTGRDCVDGTHLAQDKN